MFVFDPRDYGANPNDNNDDTFAIQAALDAARDAGGGHVLLSAGTYILTGGAKASYGALRIYDNTEISGAGMGKTILKMQDGWETKITGMIRTPVNQATENVIIRDLTLDGNRDNVSAEIDGIMTGVLPGKDEHDNNILIERVEIHDVSRIAFNPHEQTHNLTIRDSVAHHNSWDGFIADYVVNGVYENNLAYSNDRHGFNVVTHSNNMVLKDNVAYDNAEQGIVLQRGSGSTTIDGWEEMLNHDILVINNEVYMNGENGILLKQVQDNQIVGNIIYGNGKDGIQIEGAFGNIIDGNKITANVNGIELRAYTGSIAGPDDSHDNIVINNIIKAGGDAMTENHDTTINNIYAENTITTGEVDLGSKAILLTSADSYTLLNITAQLPSNDTTDTPTDSGNSDDNTTGTTDSGNDNATNTTNNSNDNTTDTGAPVVEDQFISGDNSSETLLGGAGNDTIKGRKGDDTLLGGDGDDYLEGNAGDDILIGGLGADLLKGSAGIDTFVFTKMTDAGDRIKDFNSKEKIDLANIVKDFENFNSTSAFKDGFIRLKQNGDDVDLYLNSKGPYGSVDDVLFLTLQNKSVTSIKSDNFILEKTTSVELNIDPPTDVAIEPLDLSGTSGDDTLTGSFLDDKLAGRKGDDTLIGHQGDDDLWGNDGNDTLYGGAGSDRMKGGDGADTFILDASLPGIDTIRDFRSADTLEIRNILDLGSAHDKLFEFIKLSEKGDDTIISVDIDGSKNGAHFTQIAELSGVSNLGDATDLYNDGSLILT